MPLDTLKEIPITSRNGYDYFPATESFLQKYLSQTTINNWKKLKEKHENIYVNPNLRPYQKEGAQKIIKNKAFAIFDEQRLGKTPMLLAALKEIPNLGTTLIIAPKSTLGSWKKECEKWYTNSVAIASGTKEQRLKIYQKMQPKVILASYKTIYLDEKYLPEINCIVIDEAHRLRNYKGQRSKYSPISVKKIMQIAYRCERRYVLTGTPAANKSENIFPILHLLYPTLFTSYYKFLDYYYVQDIKFLNKAKTKHIVEVKNFRKGKQIELQEFLNDISVQRKRKDYMEWLPKVDKKEIYLKLPEKEEIWYNELRETYECEELGIECPNLLSLLTALRKLTTISEVKKEWVLNYIEDYPDEQIMIVSEFTSHLKELHKIIKGSKLLIGDTKTEERTKLEQDFNNYKYKILLANITVAKEGMKLEQCNTIIMLDSSLTYTDNLQLEDRLLPTTREVAVYKQKQQIIKLLIEDTIDIIIHNQLENKATYVDIVNNFKEFLKTHT